LPNLDASVTGRWSTPTSRAQWSSSKEWTGEDALEEHFGTAHFKRVAEVLDEILVEPFAATKLARLDDADVA
jgi:quinol monooxygenase YgiN